MFEIGKKGAPETSSRPDSGPARPETSAPRSSAVGNRDAAVIGPSIHIDGDVRGEEDLLIEGEVNGTLQLKSNSLTVGPQGKVRADVYAHSIIVDGLVEGDLFGSERVAIRKSAQVRGNITSPRVSLEDGAKFKGSIEMDPQAVQTSAGRVAAPARSAAPASAPKPAAAAAPPAAVPGVKTGP
jgi:cytoskeletal protein CcmA (bactofilin family)